MNTKTDQSLGKVKIIADGICKVNSVYILTEEAYNEFVKCKEELETVKDMIDKI